MERIRPMMVLSPPVGGTEEDLAVCLACCHDRKKFSHTGVISAAKSHPTYNDFGRIVVENTGKWLVLMEVASHVQLCKM
jgi:hypothetical protein